jgi:hypothetical protein
MYYHRDRREYCDRDRDRREHCERDREHWESNWNCSEEQEHTHEYEGSVKIAEREEDPHNHRFAGVTGEAIFNPDGTHFHKLFNRTDFYEEHFHKMCDITGPGILLEMVDMYTLKGTLHSMMVMHTNSNLLL